jgi:CRISPR-associated exonuclease Cas4
MEDNSEIVKIGKEIHEEKAFESKNSEIAIDNIKLDKLTKEYLTEIKKSDADPVSSRWQLLYYLKILKKKGIERKGKLEFVEKNKKGKKTEIIELTEEQEELLEKYEQEIEELLASEIIPPVLNETKCKKCAYYEYCYI